MPTDITQPLPFGNNTRAMLRMVLSERRLFQRGSLDWQWRTRAARKYINLCRGVPVAEWTQ